MECNTIDILQEEFDTREKAYEFNHKSNYKLSYGKTPISFLVTIDNITNKLKECYGKGENRTLTFEEIQCIYALCNTIIAFKNNNYSDTGIITLGTGRSCCSNSIFKTPDDVWVVWDTDERNGANLKGVYDNCYEACIESINVLKENKEWNKESNLDAIEYFENLVHSEIDNNHLIDFAKGKHYTINDIELDKGPQLIKKY